LLRAPGRFIAIFFIVVLGAGFLAGLQSSAPAMVATADDYFAQKKLADFRLSCDLGITTDDVAAIAALPEVAQASGSYRVDLRGNVDDWAAVYAIHSIPTDAAEGNYLSQLTLLEGRLPETAEECVADSFSSIKLGDQITITENNPEDSLKLFSPRTLTVVGLARSSAYISTARGNSGVGSGQINFFLYVPEASFTSEYYTGVDLRLVSTEGLSAFSEDYAAAIDAGRTLLEDFASQRAELRHNEISTEAQASLGEAENEYSTEKTQVETDLAEAQEALESGRISLSEGKQRYDSNSTSLARSRRELDQGWADLSSAQQALTAQRGALETSRAALAQSVAALEDLRQQQATLQAALDAETDPDIRAELEAQIAALQTQIDPLAQQVSDAEAALATAEAQLVASESAYADAKSKLDAGERDYNAGETALRSLYNELQRATARIDSGQTEYDELSAEAAAALEEARAELDRSREELEALGLPAWVIEDRESLPGYTGFAADKNRIASLALILPWFFFLVAAIICATTIARMVEEHRSQIGTLKACGYRRGQIAATYQSYALLVGLTGGALGVVAGVILFPPAIWESYSTMYQMGAFMPVIAIVPCLTGFLGGTVALVLATAFACRKTLGQEAAVLMRPRAPKAGRRVLLERVRWLWHVIPFTHKVTIRNLLRYRARFAVTVIGVAGCTALLVAGFGLRDSLSGVVEAQYGENGVSHSQATLIIEDASSATADTALNAALVDTAHAYIRTESVAVSFGDKVNGEVITYLAIPEDPAGFGDFVTFRQPESHEPVPFPASETEPEVVITEQLANTLGAGIGDEIRFGVLGDIPAQARVVGIVENYVYNYIYLTPAAHETLFGALPEYYSVYLSSKLSDEDFEALLTELVALDDVATALSVSQLQSVLDVVVANMGAVVSLMVIAALVLAVVVLYNLISIMILERERELATMKVLGYYRGQVAAFVSRETTVMTIIGMALGLGLGVWLHGVVMDTIAVNELMFPRTILPQSFAFAVLFPLLCNVLVNLCLRPRLNGLDPAKSLKSIE
jgi:putative ABC transport system permease protein